MEDLEQVNARYVILSENFCRRVSKLRMRARSRQDLFCGDDGPEISDGFHTDLSLQNRRMLRDLTNVWGTLRRYWDPFTAFRDLI
jgi:hypothetical protein